MNKKAIVLLSGGIDSSTCAAIAARTLGSSNVMGLSVRYGQRHAKELNAAGIVATKLNLSKHAVITLPEEIFAGTSSLTQDGGDVPEMPYKEIENSYEVSPTYVPFRNGILLSVAAAVALQAKASYIFYGAHAEELHYFAYPDCTPEFNGAIGNAISFGTYHKLQLITPLQWMIKAEIVAKAIEEEVPLGDTYSCYKGGELHCGKCSTCLDRIEGFKRNNLIDPVKYETYIDWR